MSGMGYGTDQNYGANQNYRYKEPFDKQKISMVRHRAEKLLFVISIIGTLGIGALLFHFDREKLFMFAAVVFFMIYSLHARTRAYAIKVSERNFPEIYHKSVEFAYMLGMKTVPAVYIEQQNGALNAFAAAVVGKRYTGINAEIVDVAYTGDKDFDPVFYVLAHEFAHHYFGHTHIIQVFVNYFGGFIPVTGMAHSRAREYSCDRLAQLLMEKDCAREAMLLCAGRRLYNVVDLNDYIDQASTERGPFLWFTNMLATHPIPLKRIAALADPSRRSGKLF